jgi:hypothetical protein
MGIEIAGRRYIKSYITDVRWEKNPAKVIAFLTEHTVVDRIIDHLKLTFVADRPPPSHVFEQVALEAAEGGGGIFLSFRNHGEREPVIVRPVREGFSPKEPLRGRPEGCLTSPPGRR